ncbi:MAG TPA: hypothetical protein VMX96_02565 [Dehalococcoidia bacterium]|nr:hypothetical protein [Dehalococcoidia bacterium]
MTVDKKYSFEQIMDFLFDFVMNGVTLKNGGNLIRSQVLVHPFSQLRDNRITKLA